MNSLNAECNVVYVEGVVGLYISAVCLNKPLRE
jgi:hypothetical protein